MGYLCVIGLPACTERGESTNQAKSQSDIEAIKAVMTEYVSGYESRDPSRFLEVFTKDAVRMQPNGPAIVGSKAIRDYYEEWFEKESLDVKLTSNEIRVSGDWAFAWGSYEAKVTSISDGASRTDLGKWLNVFKRGDDGSWRFYRNIWNSDLPISVGESLLE